MTGRIVVVGEYQLEPSEGMQVVTKALVDGLRGRGEAVSILSPLSLLMRTPFFLFGGIKAIIFTHGPGSGTLFLSGVVKRFSEGKIIWLAPRPALKDVNTRLSKFAHVDAVVASRLSPEIEQILDHSKGKYLYAIHGIDLSCFSTKRGGRDVKEIESGKEFFDLNRPVILHVGHIRENRGLERLAKLKRQIKDSAEVVVLGSPTFPPDKSTLKLLVDSGVRVVIKFIKDLAPYYRKADLYIFPAANEEGGAVDLPLSVLEARACGTQVLTTPYGSLLKVLKDCDGINFVQPESLVDVCVRMFEGDRLVKRELAPLDRSFDLSRLPEKVFAVLEGGEGDG